MARRARTPKKRPKRKTSARSTRSARSRKPRRSSWRLVIDPKSPKRYARWVRALRGKNGAYLLKNQHGEVIYAGESHSKQLYDTLTRHFQKWTGPTAGIVVERELVLARVKITRTGRMAVKLQNLWIKRYDPLMNTQGKTQTDDDDVAPDSTPF